MSKTIHTLMDYMNRFPTKSESHIIRASGFSRMFCVHLQWNKSDAYLENNRILKPGLKQNIVKNCKIEDDKIIKVIFVIKF